ncbi:sulfate ABC transporter permease subunit CysW [Geminisphaera colitermitum]|uniref:sulfate ABC transporter permease subunit CysW n=1 Tax=Geminisphaera colitermitum TaxID=1148786 RepID=UPI000158E2B3|nr:sulfate ABC transporter permease subunit CysW [Geminisphaera colitermitum]
MSSRASIWTHPRRLALVLTGAGSATLLILLPLFAVFYYALRDGWAAYVGCLLDAATRHSILLTLLAALVAVPVNTAFGITAAWAVAKFEFPGRRLLISLIELPLSISPIVIGVAYLFVFGMQGLFGPWLMEHGIRLVFSIPAILIVTTIVTCPFVFREILPLMQSQGTQEEQAAIILGASGWQTFFRVTLPNIKWALIYGVSLALARSLGEFGSVAVVSGAVRGETNTMTLQIQLLFDDRVQTGAFAVASILTTLALATLILKTWVEHRDGRKLKH